MSLRESPSRGEHAFYLLARIQKLRSRLFSKPRQKHPHERWSDRKRAFDLPVRIQGSRSLLFSNLRHHRTGRRKVIPLQLGRLARVQSMRPSFKPPRQASDNGDTPDLAFLRLIEHSALEHTMRRHDLRNTAKTS
jgi:hypothetical protein